MKLELGDYLIIFLKDKVVLSKKGDAKHITFHAGPVSKQFDLHETTTIGEAKEYKTIYKASHAEVFSALEKTSMWFNGMVAGSYGTLNLKMFSRKSIGAIVLYQPPESKFETFLERKRGRSSINMKKLREKIWNPDFLDELYSIKRDEYFILYQCRPRGRPTRFGTGIKIHDGVMKNKLLWIKDVRINHIMRGAETLINDLKLIQL